MKGSLLLFSVMLCLLLSCGPGSGEGTAKVEPAKKDSVEPAIPEPPTSPYPGVDISPMDMCYFPVDYPKMKMAKSTEAPPRARVIYSRPHLQGRNLFPDILQFNEPWRLGANESTELQLFGDATVKGKKIPAGRYILYCIPSPENWIIVFNSNTDTWGLQQDASKDIARVEVPSTRSTQRLEYFSMAFEPNAEGADLLMAWDTIEVRLPFIF
jgi:hypothetical protein